MIYTSNKPNLQDMLLSPCKLQWCLNWNEWKICFLRTKYISKYIDPYYTRSDMWESTLTHVLKVIRAFEHSNNLNSDQSFWGINMQEMKGRKSPFILDMLDML